MTTTVKSVEILTTLEEDPHVTFFAWESDVHDVASGMAKSIHPLGLLSDILTDEQWTNYPGNSTMVNGQVQIAPRYTPPVYIEIVATMTNIELYVAKATNDKLQLWTDSAETLKRAVIKSLGRVVRQIVRAPRIRFQRMSVADIINRVRARFGRMQRDTKSALEAKMLTMLLTTDKLDTHISDLQDMFDVSETAGYPLDERRKVEIFRETVCAHPLILKVLEEFDFDFPDVRTCSYAQICDFLILHLPNIKHAQSAATKASANLVAATAYATLEAESQRLRAEVDKLKRRQTPGTNKNQNQRSKKQRGKLKGNVQRETDQPTTTLKYCHAHGYQRSHVSSECKLLAADKKFTAAMRTAKDPNHPPGGSTKINGQAAPRKPKTVTANMAHDFNADEDDDLAQECNAEEDDDQFEDSDSNCLNETTMFLAGVLGDQTDCASDYSTTEITAMLMDNEALLLDDEAEHRVPSRVLSIHEVPRLTHDENQGGQIHGNKEDNIGHAVQSPSSTVDSPSCPTQATQAALKSARSCASRQSSPQTGVSYDTSLGGGKVEDEREDAAPRTYDVITDGSQFCRPFWDAEVQTLQDRIRKQLQGRRMVDIPSRRIPTSEELQNQFIKWLLERPTLPLAVSPASSGFYDEVYGPIPTRVPTSGFFDEDYVAGRRTGPVHRDSFTNTVNPASRPVLTYHEVYTAQLTTAAEIERHEQRLYQPGYTPSEIRNNIQRMLREMGPAQHLIDFAAKDIPPHERDPRTHKLLADLLQQRNDLDLDFQLLPRTVAINGSLLETTSQYDAEYRRRDAEYNRLNRDMYDIYASSAYIIHDHNFLSYCNPALRNLPVATAFNLTKLKESLRPTDSDQPPYRPTQQPTRTQTTPIFSSTRPSFADVVRPSLKPREPWMREQPPYMTDAAADQVWQHSNDSLFGRTSPTNLELEQQIKNLQRVLEQRQKSTLPLTQSSDKSTFNDDQQHPRTQTNLESRIFRQGKRTPTPDKNRKTSSSQSTLSNVSQTKKGDAHKTKNFFLRKNKHEWTNQKLPVNQIFLFQLKIIYRSAFPDKKRRWNEVFRAKVKVMRMMIQLRAGLLQLECDGETQRKTTTKMEPSDTPLHRKQTPIPHQPRNESLTTT